MKFSGITDESTKMTVFRMKAGPRLIDVMDNTFSSPSAPDEVELPYSNVMFRLKQFYGSRDYILLQRQRLRSMMQGATEGDVIFVKRVATAAKLCDYGNEQLMESVADVVQSHALNSKVREAARKILRKGGAITELLDKVRSAEVERQSEELYAMTHKQPVANIAAVSYSSSRVSHNEHQQTYRGKADRFRSRGAPRGRGYLNRYDQGSDNRRLHCWRCGSTFHRSQNCHAVDKVCRRCQVKGHIERVCRLVPEEGLKRHAAASSEPVPDPKIRKITMTADVEKDLSESADTKPVSELN